MRDAQHLAGQRVRHDNGAILIRHHHPHRSQLCGGPQGFFLLRQLFEQLHPLFRERVQTGF